MSKRLGKDERAKLIAEYEKEGKISDPNFYVIKDKNGKTQVRRVRAKKESKDEQVDNSSVDSGSAEESKTVKEPKEKTL